MLSGILRDRGRIADGIQGRRVIHGGHIDVKGLDRGSVRSPVERAAVVVDLDGNNRGAVGVGCRRVSQVSGRRDRGLRGEQRIIVVSDDEIYHLPRLIRGTF